jgi:large subunit ribosomal protein L23
MAIFNSKKEKSSASKTTHKARAVKKLVDGTANDVIRAPWFSEKALLATEKSVYAFAVSPRSSKAEIAGAIKALYNVEPKAVRIVNLPAKKKNMRTRRGVGVRAARRKAYVYLNKGETITFA